MNTDIPIVIFIYNRYELTTHLIEILSVVKPENIILISDGGKNLEDWLEVNRTRELFRNLNWKCNLITEFSDVNLGCANRIISGLDFVFSKADKAILLEDDCIPHPSFFPYCKELLERYENDEEIMHISGFNALEKVEMKESYFFSKFILPPWGWATWKRAWKNFNHSLDTWQEIKTTAYKNISQENFATWTDMFENIRVNKTTWDTPWNVDIWKNNGLGIIPKKSLVQNIGFGEKATFTINPSNLSLVKSSEMDFPLVHPSEKHILFENEMENKIAEGVRQNIPAKK